MAINNIALTSYFDALGFKETIRIMKEQVASFYLEDSVPWVIGFSGGKDSTAVLQLIWEAIKTIPQDRLHKQINVITTDTGVENPKVSGWVEHVLTQIEKEALSQGLPIRSNKLQPKTEDSFWVSLIGKGYPAPRPNFRWCTSRLKISPSHNFINTLVNQFGECILALGTRKSESQSRGRNMVRHEKFRTRDNLSPNSQLRNCMVFTPIEDWSNDDVWLFLTRSENPWKVPNTDLLELYKEATQDRECPLVVDESTPSCGSSRFGCWVCTMVAKDASMDAMIANDINNKWLIPLTEFRDLLDITDDTQYRDVRRISGEVQLLRDSDRHIPGPYIQERRHLLLRELFRTEIKLRKFGPKEFKDIILINADELREIRRIWIEEKHEIEDTLPRIYEEECGEVYPEKQHYALPFKENDFALLSEVCGENHFLYELSRELLSVGWGFRSMAKRSGLYPSMEKAFKRSFFDNTKDALNLARLKKRLKADLSSETMTESIASTD